MYKKKNITLSVAFTGMLFLFSINSQAAERIDLSKNSKVGIMSSSNSLRMLNNKYKFKQVAEVKLPSGKIKYRLAQYYNGVLVYNTAVSSDNKSFTSFKNSGLFAMNSMENTTTLKGSIYVGLEHDINTVAPSLSTNKVVNIAKNKANVVSNGFINKSDIKNINTNLVIKNYQDNNKTVAKLVYIVDMLIDNGDNINRPYSIIDAHSGEVLEHWNGLTSKKLKTAPQLDPEDPPEETPEEKQVDATGPGGNEKTGKYYYGRDYKHLVALMKTVDSDDGDDGDNNDESISEGQVKCYMDSPNVVTYNLNSSYSRYGGDIHEFDCFENTYKEVNGAYSPINDAHYFGNVVFDMYSDWYDAAPISFKLKLKVHYGRSVENAYWTGAVMLFGDGRNKFHPLVSLDVVSHEVSHGFTEQNSGLEYRDMSGALNEAFSDMAGEASEYYMNIAKPVNERNDWLVGETIFKGEEGKALRYFEDPTKDGYSIGHVDDFEPNHEVHSSSGIFNRAFFNLATSDNWNLRKAFDAFVLANKVYWTANSTFDESGCGVRNAAEDLELNANDVIAAFDIVGINATCQVPEEPEEPEEESDS